MLPGLLLEERQAENDAADAAPTRQGQVAGADTLVSALRPTDALRLPGIEGSIDPRVSSVCWLLEQHWAEPLKVSELAARVGLGQRRLRLLFKRDLGLTMMEVVLELRLQAARLMLRQTFLRVSEVAFKVGFSSASHFSRAFRKRFGMAPRVCRELARRNLDNGEEP